MLYLVDSDSSYMCSNEWSGSFGDGAGSSKGIPLVTKSGGRQLGGTSTEQTTLASSKSFSLHKWLNIGLEVVPVYPSEFVS